VLSVDDKVPLLSTLLPVPLRNATLMADKQCMIVGVPWHKKVKAKVSHTRYGADPGVQAVSRPAVGCHYFPPGLRLPSQSHFIYFIYCT